MIYWMSIEQINITSHHMIHVQRRFLRRCTHNNWFKGAGIYTVKKALAFHCSVKLKRHTRTHTTCALCISRLLRPVRCVVVQRDKQLLCLLCLFVCVMRFEFKMFSRKLLNFARWQVLRQGVSWENNNSSFSWRKIDWMWTTERSKGRGRRKCESLLMMLKMSSTEFH